MARSTLASRAGAVIVSSLAFLAAGEVAVRMYARHHLVYDLEMARYARELKIDASNARIGHVHRPGSAAHLMGVEVRINSDGLRDRDYPVARDGRYRMVFLGDSLTLGWGVRQEDTFENLMEEAIDRERPVEILNFGVGNYNTAQETALFIEKGLKYRPDKVVLFYFVNDAEQTPRAARWSVFARSQFVSFYWSHLRTLARRASASGDYRSHYASLYTTGARGWEDAKASLLLLQQTCRDRGIVLQVVLLPELHELHPYPFAREHAIVSAFLTGHGVDRLDLAPMFENAGDPSRLWVAADDAHPNATAHRLIAQYATGFVSPRERTTRDAEETVGRE